jgi:hypothetical protein
VHATPPAVKVEFEGQKPRSRAINIARIVLSNLKFFKLFIWGILTYMYKHDMKLSVVLNFLGNVQESFPGP